MGGTILFPISITEGLSDSDSDSDPTAKTRRLDPSVCDPLCTHFHMSRVT